MADRLKLKARHSVVAITVVSFYVVVLSLLSLIFQDRMDSLSERLSSTATVIMSMFIIVLNLLESARNYSIESEYANIHAHEMERLFNRIDDQDLKSMETSKEYSDILDRSRVRHKMIDYDLFRLSNPSAFKFTRLKWGAIVLSYVRGIIGEYWLYVVVVAGPPILIGAIIALNRGIRFGP
jgi:hypothetical protein